MRLWRAGMPVRWPVGLKFAAPVGAVVLGDAAATDRLIRVSKDLDDYVALRRADPTVGPADRAVLLTQVTAVFDRMTSEVVAVRDNEYATTEISAEEARDTYSSTQLQLVIGTAASLLVALTVVLLLVRNL
ncbi:MAG: hypothetical protein QOH17_2875, partial [Pseudonocardiales bacterium]|nr:hypothetical protein [Pseudonocardiales bacterium]